MMRSVFGLVVALALLSATASAQQAAAIGALHLGMTLDEVRRVDPGVGNRPRDLAALLVPFRLNGILFAAILEFRDGRVSRINMGGGSGITDANACLAALPGVLGDVEAQVGPLDGAAPPWPDAEAPVTTPGGSHIFSQPGQSRAGAYRVNGDVISAIASFRQTTARVGGDTRTRNLCDLRVTLTRPPAPVAASELATQPELDAAQLLEHPRWLARPSAVDFAAAYPPLASDFDTEGRAVLDCLIVEDGRLRCLASSEDPAAAGFGAAALWLSRSLRSDAQVDGVPTLGRKVHLPINFRLATE